MGQAGVAKDALKEVICLSEGRARRVYVRVFARQSVTFLGEN